MLIYPDAAMLKKPERQALSSFCRKPFTEESCALVADRLPYLAQVYRALANSMSTWRGGILLSQVRQADRVFQQVARSGPDQLPLVPEQVLARQVELLEELVRDHADFLHQRSERPNQRTKLDADSSRLALRAFSFHEAAFLTLMGILEAQVTRQLVTFSFTPRGGEILYNRTITTTMESQSQLSLTLVLRDVIARLRHGDPTRTASIPTLLQPELLDTLEEAFLDCFFSIGAYTSRDADSSQLISGARELCRWFALLEIVRLADEAGVIPCDTLCDRLKLDRDLLNRVLADRAGAVPSDRGIYVDAYGSLSLGKTGLGHAVHCCKSAVLSKGQARDLGDKFEKEMTEYLARRVSPADYVVRPGLKRSDNGEGEMYDCDLIIFEVARRQIFFVQAKWKRNSRTADLGDELNCWRDENWPLTKGVKQLVVLRQRLAEKDVLAKIKGALGDIKLSDQHILANSHYVVVHTLPSFSAYQIDGVAIYEWNLFRRLLQRGAMERSLSTGGPPALAIALPEHRHHTVLKLEDPNQVLDYFYTAAGGALARLPREKQDREQARYGFDLALPSASLWSRMRGHATLRVIRPYT
ncbi:hypothetical protein IV454_04795 [Massilia antarctica]|uniref:NERD domain-containing protein n=1 Tax=Massilia antarctica TaxID=2765360 RepID=A0AA48WG02_9BURK|nr:hypothetical protein [Massilia antarctica]QPI50887.1 hypothetical protein IV454_04795 [Massilia antarctica]